MSLRYLAWAHLGAVDGHTGGLTMSILLAIVAIVALMLYIAYLSRPEDEDDLSSEG